jgi:CrcB protein
MTFALVAAGGALGALARYAISLAALKHLGDSWPWGTLMANLLGCLALGVVTHVVARPGVNLEGLRLFAAVGLLGSLTTFSTLCFEVVVLIQNRSISAAIAYVGASLVGGLFLAAGGWFAAGRAIP